MSSTIAARLATSWKILRPDDLLLSPALAHRDPVTGLSLLGSAPSNQAILDATRQFYSAHQPVVDTSAHNTGSVSQSQPSFVNTMNGYGWKSQQLTPPMQTTTGTAIFGSTAAATARTQAVRATEVCSAPRWTGSKPTSCSAPSA